MKRRLYEWGLILSSATAAACSAPWIATGPFGLRSGLAFDCWEVGVARGRIEILLRHAPGYVKFERGLLGLYWENLRDGGVWSLSLLNLAAAFGASAIWSWQRLRRSRSAVPTNKSVR